MNLTAHSIMRRAFQHKKTHVAAFCFAVLMISYCDRVNLATVAPVIMNQYRWNPIQMGWVLSGFFLGYTSCLIPAGLLVQRYGAWPVLAVGIVGWSLVTALTPLSRSIAEMYCMRVLLGVCESGTFPAINTLLVEWFPPEEHARAAGFCWSGGYAGPILAFPMAGMILQAWGWRAVFYTFGTLGAMLLVAQARFANRLPRNPRSRAVRTAHPQRLLASPAVWALLSLHFSSNWFAYVLLSWLPTYLQQGRHFSVTSASFGSAFPFIAALLGTSLFAALIDKLSVHHARTAVRKSFLGLYLLGGITLLAVPMAKTAIWVVGTLSLSSWLMTAATPIYASGSLDLLPRSAAILVGIQVSFANLAGIIAPAASGYLIKAFSWNAVFAVTVGVCFLGTVAYLLFGSAEALAGLEPMDRSPTTCALNEN